MSKLGNDEAVTTDTLAKIYMALNCTFDDIMEILPEVKLHVRFLELCFLYYNYERLYGVALWN